MGEDTAIWFEPQAETPELDEDAFGLACRIYSSPDEGRPCLAAAFRVPGRFAGVYGGRITAAIQVLAVDARSGDIHYREAEPRTGIPLVPGSPEGMRLPSAVSGNFGIDIAGHLVLPDERRTYLVFLWLDEIVSPLAVVETPGGEPEPEAGTEPAAPALDAAARVLRLSPLPALPDASSAAEIRLVSVRAEERVRIEGAVHLPAPVAAGAPVPLAVLGLCDVTHRLGWVAARLPASPEGATGWGFAVDAERLVAPRAAPRRLHIVAVAGEALSPVLSVDLAPR